MPAKTPLALGPSAWPLGLDQIGYGGDYNPEQWPREVRKRDLELMRGAGVNFLSVGIFSWAKLEPREGEYDFDWLDEVLDDLHSIGVRVALATATAAPPPWLTTKHPEILPVSSTGVVLGQGSRQSYCPNSPVYAEYSAGITRRVAERYREHPALALWHVDNELGCHNFHCYSPDCVLAFREWLGKRYGAVEAVNHAWGTAFWSQGYSTLDEINPPAAAPTFLNPTQQLDYQRFLFDSQREVFRRLVSVLREVTPGVPATTNFMLAGSKDLNYLRWGEDMDVVANDHYTQAANHERHIELAMSADMTRAAARSNPWILMEHSTSAVNWQPINRAKPDGEMLRNSLNHLARGADSIMFFQWRQGRAGSEKFHSAMVPHAERDSVVWRNTVALGAALRALAPVKGTRVRAEAAIMVDSEAWWASEIDCKPSEAHRYGTEVAEAYRELWRRNITTDFVHPSWDLTGYRLIVVPALYLVNDADAERLTAAVAAGATVVITYFSGISDENDHVRLGGYPGAFKQLLGIHTDEFYPLLADEQVEFDTGGHAHIWTERIETRGAEARITLASGPLQGWPAVTRATHGAGTAWYQGVDLDRATRASLYDEILADASVAPLRELPAPVAGPAGGSLRGASEPVEAQVELVRRTGEQGSFLFVFNHGDALAEVPARGLELLRGQEVDGVAHVPGGGVAVIQEA
ncbi:beta-galactosidase [Micrococcales bacterium 31B]|nr:beta-galactosidase [Micrococcales bacterium 31B]